MVSTTVQLLYHKQVGAGGSAAHFMGREQLNGVVVAIGGGGLWWYGMYHFNF